MNHINPYQRNQDQTEAAQKQFNESEWRLAFLRTKSAEPNPEPTKEQICKTFTQTHSPQLLWN